MDQDNAQKARAVLNQTIQALGGSAYLNLQDISQEGRTYSFYHGRPNSLGILFWRFYKFPDKDRIELTKQRDVVYVYNGDKGTEITFKGPRPEDRQRSDRVFAATPLLPRLGAQKVAVGTGRRTCSTRARPWPKKNRSNKSRS